MVSPSTTGMRAFRDSRDALEDGAELRRRMELDGYLFLPGLMPRRDVAALRVQFQAIAAESGWLVAGTDPSQSLA
ncbi:MAG TPA: hypothetical protein VGD75_04010, partial [Bradyrhizobium sp.]